jgi:hypothetical protein
MLRLLGLAVLFLLLTGANTPVLAMGGGGGGAGGNAPMAPPCSLFGVRDGGAVLGHVTPAMVDTKGGFLIPGLGSTYGYYVAPVTGVLICEPNTTTLWQAITFAPNGNVGISYNNINNSGSYTAADGGHYYNLVQPVAKLDVSGDNVTFVSTDYYANTTPGGVRFGNDAATCDSAHAGEMIYTGGAIQYCNASSWGSFEMNTGGTVGGTSPGVLVELTAGSAAAPSLTFYADTTTGIYQPATGTLAVTTNGVERAVFDASGNLNLLTTGGGYGLPVCSAYWFGIPADGCETYASAPALWMPSGDSSGTSLGVGNALSSVLTGQGNTGVGDLAGAKLTSGAWNTAIGYAAMQYATQSSYSTAAGYEAMQGTSGAAVTGNNNTAIGYQSLAALTSGTDNTAAGFQALTKTTSGSGNTVAGVIALYSNVSGSNSVAVGYQVLYDSTSGPNTAVGYYALGQATSGTQNTAVGYGALDSVTTGTANTAIGDGALSSTTIGSYNTAAGYATSVADGSYNISIGGNAGNAGSYNIAIGQDAFTASSDNYNIAIGDYALNSSTSGNQNIAIGSIAQRYAATGSSNIAIGYAAMQATSGSGLSGNGNIGIGYEALYAIQTTATANTAIGTSALLYVTTGVGNTALDQNAILALTIGNYNTAAGYQPLRTATTGSDSTAIGYDTLYDETAPGPNTAVGYESSYHTSTGINNTSLGNVAMNTGTATLLTGNNNLAIGYKALYYINGAAANNTVVGALAGDSASFAANTDNTFFGYNAGHLVTGSSNIIIGNSGASSISSGGSNIQIGNSVTGATSTSSNQLDIGDLIEGQTSSATSPNVAFHEALADASLSVQTPATGFSITVGNGVGTLILTPAATLATGTVTMPAAPVKGQILHLASTHTVTSLTLSANAGQSVQNAITTISATTPATYMYIDSATTWYRIR